MRKSLFLVSLLFIAAAPAAHAANCNTGTVESRLTCLQGEIDELTKHDLQLQTAVDTLTKQVAQIPKLDNIAISYVPHPSSCITYRGNNLLQVTDQCHDTNQNRFAIVPFQ
jgi:hypothetical protein